MNLLRQNIKPGTILAMMRALYPQREDRRFVALSGPGLNEGGLSATIQGYWFEDGPERPAEVEGYEIDAAATRQLWGAGKGTI